jgi:hypothetical protein
MERETGQWEKHECGGSILLQGLLPGRGIGALGLS